MRRSRNEKRLQTTVSCAVRIDSLPHAVVAVLRTRRCQQDAYHNNQQPSRGPGRSVCHRQSISESANHHHNTDTQGHRMGGKHKSSKRETHWLSKITKRQGITHYSASGTTTRLTHNIVHLRHLRWTRTSDHTSMEGSLRVHPPKH